MANDESQRAKWTDDDGWTPHAVVISLGTKDWTLQKSDPIREEEFVTKYIGLLQDVRKHYPKALIVVTKARSLPILC